MLKMGIKARLTLFAGTYYHLLQASSPLKTNCFMKVKRIKWTLFCLTFCLSLVGCKDESLPVVITYPVEDITSISVAIKGYVVEDGGAPITSRGVAWGLLGEQNDENFLEAPFETSGTGEFHLILSGLIPNKTYFVKAFATNEKGTAFGNSQSFAIPDGIQGTVTDIEGNVYATITLATNEWMTENLRTTKFRDGTEIALVTDNSQWHSTLSPAFCWFDNAQETYGNVYGALYNGYAVLDNRGLCPEGWRVSTNDDWSRLINYFYTGLGIDNNDFSNDGTGNRLKSCRQINSPLGGNCNTDQHPRWDQNPFSFYSDDSFGFSALPGGLRTSFENPGAFKDIGSLGCFWTSTPSTGEKYHYKVFSEYTSIKEYSGAKNHGFSVRCVRDVE